MAACRQSFADRLHIAESIADDPGSTPMERLKALELLARFGGLARVELAAAEHESQSPVRTFIVAGVEIQL